MAQFCSAEASYCVGCVAWVAPDGLPGTFGDSISGFCKMGGVFSKWGTLRNPHKKGIFAVPRKIE